MLFCLSDFYTLPRGERGRLPEPLAIQIGCVNEFLGGFKISGYEQLESFSVSMYQRYRAAGSRERTFGQAGCLSSSDSAEQSPESAAAGARVFTYFFRFLEFFWAWT
jgi:hypothetical protein